MLERCRCLWPAHSRLNGLWRLISYLGTYFGCHHHFQCSFRKWPLRFLFIFLFMSLSGRIMKIYNITKREGYPKLKFKFSIISNECVMTFWSTLKCLIVYFGPTDTFIARMWFGYYLKNYFNVFGMKATMYLNTWEWKSNVIWHVHQ